LLFIQTTAALGINDRVNEILGITAELKIMFQGTNFIKQVVILGIWQKIYCEDYELNIFSHAADG
jgi:hypothetical protein